MKTQAALNEFLQSRLATNLSPITIDWYRQKLGRFARSYPEVPESPGPIEEFLASVHGSAQTKHAYYRCLKAFYRFLRKRHRLPDPIELIDPPRRPVKVMPTLEPDEEMRLLDSASSLRDRAILTLFVDSGMRTSELATLRRQDIQADILLVRGKSGEREVPISEETRRLLLALIDSEGKGEYIFRGYRGGPLSRHGVYRIVSAHMRKANITGPKVGAHRIRHAFGKGYLVNGGDLRSLQKIMGHSNITTTEKYAELNRSDITTKHHKFTPLRAAHAAAQSFFAVPQAVKEAEAILKGKVEIQEEQEGANRDTNP